MCRSRAVGSRATPSASATSCPCAQVSISRAVAIEATLIGGPYQGSLAPAGWAASARCSASRPSRQRARSTAGGSFAPSSAASSTKVSGVARACRAARAKASGSVAESSACRSVHSRWAIWWATVQPAAGVGCAHRPAGSPATSASSSSLSALRSAGTAPGSDTRHSPRRPHVAYARGRLTGVVVRYGSEGGSAPRNNQARLHDFPARIGGPEFPGRSPPRVVAACGQQRARPAGRAGNRLRSSGPREAVIRLAR